MLRRLSMQVPPPFATDPFFKRSATTSVLETIASPAYHDKTLSDPNFKHYREYFDNAKKNLKILVDAGVKYGLVPTPVRPERIPGYFEHWEMELMVEAGLTPDASPHGCY